jgi:hypothetical protein
MQWKTWLTHPGTEGLGDAGNGGEGDKLARAHSGGQARGSFSFHGNNGNVRPAALRQAQHSGARARARVGGWVCVCVCVCVCVTRHPQCQTFCMP